MLLLLLSQTAWSKHIKGGEIEYRYIGPGAAPNTDHYLLTLRLFISCNATEGQLETEVNLSIYQTADNEEVAASPFTAGLDRSQIISLTKPSPCIINPSPVCYWIREYTVEVTLPKIPAGYTVVFQRCCRLDGISNLTPNLNIGATYSCQIHGTNSVGLTGINSNPDFGIKDTVLICQKHRFTLDYSAKDADGDSMSYQFITGQNGGSANNPIVNDAPPPSALVNLRYATGFSGLQPMGTGVTIDPRTGIISGVAPKAGNYVVCVLVSEYRNKVLLTQHRKDFIIHVDDRCDFPSAALDPTYITCDGFSFQFANESPATPLVHTYFWNFGVPGSTTDTTSNPTPKYTFPVAGTYPVKLLINKGEACSDSATTQLKIYPGFFPGFTVSGGCVKNPFFFTDTSKANYGVISNWSWNFGDPTATNDTSTQKNPSYQYHDTGTAIVQFIVASSVGCMDTITKNVAVLGKPYLLLPFHDTLICNIDTLTLHALGTGVFTWTPTTSLLGSNTADPTVFPQFTTRYTVNLNADGCINEDTVNVRVVDHVTLTAGNDSTICLGDTILLNPTGDALYFAWTPTASLNDPSLRHPAADPTASTQYHVIGSIGKCFASSDVTIRTIPYPGSNAGTSPAICYGDTVQLHGTYQGIRYYWTPGTGLIDSLSISPLASPKRSTLYSLYVYDTLGCPKPGISSVLVDVAAQLFPFAGNDTSIVVGQPLQLNGSGADAFLWSPPNGLSATDIPDPVAHLDQNGSYILKVYTEQGCFALDTINVKVFTTEPDIFVPNAFTPGNTINAVFRPIPVGVSSIEFFRVYNRDGRLVYSTNQIGRGWDGSVNGKPQDSGGFVWMVKGTDYLGRIIAKKGTMVLVR